MTISMFRFTSPNICSVILWLYAFSVRYTTYSITPCLWDSVLHSPKASRWSRLRIWKTFEGRWWNTYSPKEEAQWYLLFFPADKVDPFLFCVQAPTPRVCCELILYNHPDSKFKLGKKTMENFRCFWYGRVYISFCKKICLNR